MINGTTQQPIFIVGLPRSGTTLLTAMLGAHSRLSCGPETYVFSDLTGNTERAILSDKVWPDRSVEYLFSIIHGKDSAPVTYGISQEELSDYLRGKKRTLASVASALPELLMMKLGKQRWIEKTPGHIMYTDKIRTHFPEAPIIQIRRDPRDVALSLVNVPWGHETFLGALTYCYKHHTKDAFFDRDTKSCTVHYEDLLSSPERELQHICDFLQESFEPSMLDTKQAAARIDSGSDSWMKKAGEQVDRSRSRAWKTVLTAEQKRQADAIVGCYTEERDALATTLPVFIRIVGFASTRSSTTDFSGLERLGKMIQESNVRFWPADDDERPVGTLFIGNPESRELLGYGSSRVRLSKALSIARKLVTYRICGHPVAWPYMAAADWSSLSLCSKLLFLALGLKRVLNVTYGITVLP
jgi:hypothetical protein